jgi:hypothetical protein
MKRIALLAVGILLIAQVGSAQGGADETEARLRALEERLRALEAELRALKSAAGNGNGAAANGVAPLAPASAAPPGSSATAIPAPAASAVPASPPQYAPQGQLGGGLVGKVLNPDISVIGNFVGSIGKNSIRPVSSLEMKETEIAFQAIVDPYARADFFVAFTPEGAELEEGYLTFTALPAGLVARVGKMRAAFGRINLLHNDALPWIDRPLVIDNLVAGDEGINDAGLSVSRILPAPGGIFLEGTAQVYRGEVEDLFVATEKRDLAVVGHLRGYGDITENTNLNLGFSYARGSNDQGSSFHTNLYGVDATLRWKPLRRAIYKSFLWRTEFVWSRRDQLPAPQRAFGLFTAGEYRLNRRWTLGGRFDRSGRADDANLTDTGFSALLTYWPSEFSQIRGQYRFARYAEGRDGNEFRFQFLFVLGAHGAHPF